MPLVVLGIDDTVRHPMTVVLADGTRRVIRVYKPRVLNVVWHDEAEDEAEDDKACGQQRNKEHKDKPEAPSVSAVDDSSADKFCLQLRWSRGPFSNRSAAGPWDGGDKKRSDTKTDGGDAAPPLPVPTATTTSTTIRIPKPWALAVFQYLMYGRLDIKDMPHALVPLLRQGAEHVRDKNQSCMEIVSRLLYLSQDVDWYLHDVAHQIEKDRNAPNARAQDRHAMMPVEWICTESGEQVHSGIHLAEGLFLTKLGMANERVCLLFESDLQHLFPDCTLCTSYRATVCDTCCRVHASASTLKSCGRCYAVRYCSKECQLKDWTDGGHSRQCVARDRPHYPVNRSATDPAVSRVIPKNGQPIDGKEERTRTTSPPSSTSSSPRSTESKSKSPSSSMPSEQCDRENVHHEVLTEKRAEEKRVEEEEDILTSSASRSFAIPERSSVPLYNQLNCGTKVLLEGIEALRT